MRKLAKTTKRIFKRIFFFLRPKINYCALGDSTVEGIGASSAEFCYASQLANLLDEDFRIKLVNLGKSGATSRDVVETQLVHALKHQPHLITISVGPNDIRKLKTLGEFRKNLELIFKFLNATGGKIVINTIPDMSKLPVVPKLTRWFVKKRVEQFNKVICQISKSHDVTVCDLFEKSQQFEKTEEYISKDGFHLSDLGYNLWAKFLHLEIKPLLVK